METAYFAAGCFWGIQQRFSRLNGVTSTRAGYMGGTLEKPDYKAVCSGKSGHTETVKVIYDEQKIDYLTLITHFFEWHDPTQINRQGPDIGSQYRTAIFPTTGEQHDLAAAKIIELSGSNHDQIPIATKLEIAEKFWEAEDYHQDYLDKQDRGHSGL